MNFVNRLIIFCMFLLVFVISSQTVYAFDYQNTFDQKLAINITDISGNGLQNYSTVYNFAHDGNLFSNCTDLIVVINSTNATVPFGISNCTATRVNLTWRTNNTPGGVNDSFAIYYDASAGIEITPQNSTWNDIRYDFWDDFTTGADTATSFGKGWTNYSSSADNCRVFRNATGGNMSIMYHGPTNSECWAFINLTGYPDSYNSTGWELEWSYIPFYYQLGSGGDSWRAGITNNTANSATVGTMEFSNGIRYGIGDRIFSYNGSSTSVTMVDNNIKGNQSYTKRFWVNLTTSKYLSSYAIINETTSLYNASNATNEQHFNMKGNLTYLIIHPVEDTGTTSGFMSDFFFRKRATEEPSFVNGSIELFGAGGDSTPPQFYNNFTSKTSPLTYYPNNNIGFQCNWTDESSMNTTILESNHSGSYLNYTMTNTSDTAFIYNLTDYGVIGINYRFIGNDTTGNENSTDYLNFTITQNTTTENYLNISLSFNTTYEEDNLTVIYAPVDYNITVNHTRVDSRDEANNLTYVYVRNGTEKGKWNYSEIISLPAQDFNLTYNTSGNENYTSISKTFFLSILQNSSASEYMNLSVSMNTTFDQRNLTVVYSGIDFNITSNFTHLNESNDIEFLLSRNGTDIGENNYSNIVSLGAHDFNYTYNTSGNENYSSASITYYLSVSKNSSYPLATNLVSDPSTKQIGTPDPIVLMSNLSDTVNVSVAFIEVTGPFNSTNYTMSNTTTSLSGPTRWTYSYGPWYAGSHTFKIYLNNTGNENYTGNLWNTTSGGTFTVTESSLGGGDAGGTAGTSKCKSENQTCSDTSVCCSGMICKDRKCVNKTFEIEAKKTKLRFIEVNATDVFSFEISGDSGIYKIYSPAGFDIGYNEITIENTEVININVRGDKLIELGGRETPVTVKDFICIDLSENYNSDSRDTEKCLNVIGDYADLPTYGTLMDSKMILYGSAAIVSALMLVYIMSFIWNKMKKSKD